MILKKLTLKNFRNHKARNFELSPTTIIIGKNTAGKTNILEAIDILSHGKSFRAQKDYDTIFEGTNFSSIEASIQNSPSPLMGEGGFQRKPDEGENELRTKNDELTNLKVIFSTQRGYLSKKFLVNNVARRQIDFTSNFVSILFTPKDIEILTGSPGLRRRYIDSILYQADKKYRSALSNYEKALKHRNKMLYDMREGKKNYARQEFEYFEKILIEQGSILSNTREGFVNFVNDSKKDIFDFTFYYDKSEMSEARLLKYHLEERAAGVTLVGPQRDDYRFFFPPHPGPLPQEERETNVLSNLKPIQEFGSRGEERLTIFQLKVLEVNYLLKATSHTPILLLDDIFSELDDSNIHKVFDLLPTQQTILTTTHHEFVPKKLLDREDVSIIEL